MGEVEEPGEFRKRTRGSIEGEQGQSAGDPSDAERPDAEAMIQQTMQNLAQNLEQLEKNLSIEHPLEVIESTLLEIMNEVGEGRAKRESVRASLEQLHRSVGDFREQIVGVSRIAIRSQDLLGGLAADVETNQALLTTANQKRTTVRRRPWKNPLLIVGGLILFVGIYLATNDLKLVLGFIVGINLAVCAAILFSRSRW